MLLWLAVRLVGLLVLTGVFLLLFMVGVRLSPGLSLTPAIWFLLMLLLGAVLKLSLVPSSTESYTSKGLRLVPCLSMLACGGPSGFMLEGLVPIVSA